MSAGDSEILLRKFQKYRGKGLLVDTNLLLLYLVGLTRPDRLPTFKPIINQGFDQRDFELLKRLVSRFRKLITTPHILTEVSNHSDKLKGDDRHRFCQTVRLLVGQIESCEERYTKSAELCQRDEYTRLGLADTAISETAAGNFLVVTVDFELAGHLEKRRVDVINFNHLRQLN